MLDTVHEAAKLGQALQVHNQLFGTILQCLMLCAVSRKTSGELCDLTHPDILLSQSAVSSKRPP